MTIVTMIGKFIIISAPSGAGKTSLARALIANNHNVVMSVSHTTRQKRLEEVDGEDYHFVDERTFVEMVEAGAFLEYAQVYGNYYGTSRLAVEEQLNAGQHVVLDIDWQGARSVREQVDNAISISIIPPSIEELERRLRSRGSDTEDVIKSRMDQALQEMSHCQEADFIVMNDDFNRALDELGMILSGQGDKIRLQSQELVQMLGL